MVLFGILQWTNKTASTSFLRSYIILAVYLKKYAGLLNHLELGQVLVVANRATQDTFFYVTFFSFFET